MSRAGKARGSAYLFADNVALEELSLVVADKSEDKSVLRLRESARYSHFFESQLPPSLVTDRGGAGTPGRPPQRRGGYNSIMAS